MRNIVTISSLLTEPNFCIRNGRHDSLIPPPPPLFSVMICYESELNVAGRN
jgi:hypothetical protein